MRMFSRALIVLGGLAGPLAGGQSRADIITWSFDGSLTTVIDSNGVLAANSPSLGTGSTFNLLFTFNSALPPTFPNIYGPGGGVTSWWGTGHSSMNLSIGSLNWQTVGPERVDAVYNNPPPAWGGPVQQINSDHWNGSTLTNVVPGGVVVQASYHLAWIMANGATLVIDRSGGSTYAVWTLGPTSFNEPSLTPENFPNEINIANWQTTRMFLDVSLTFAGGSTATYYVEGVISGATTVPEPPTLWLTLIGVTGLLLSRRSSATGTAALTSAHCRELHHG